MSIEGKVYILGCIIFCIGVFLKYGLPVTLISIGLYFIIFAFQNTWCTLAFVNIINKNKIRGTT